MLNISRIEDEYGEGHDFLYKKKQRWVAQLALMNNLQRGDENIASTSLWTFFNQVFGNSYDDKIQMKFVPPEEADIKKAELLNKLAVSDFREMDFSDVEYDWLWDAYFFAEGFLDTSSFDRKNMILKPQVINPLHFVRDPFFTSIQEWRFYGHWIARTRNQLQFLQKLGVIGNVPGHTDISGIPAGIEAELWNYKVLREQARDAVATSPETVSGNAVYQILEFYTYDDEGNKIRVWTDKYFSKFLRYEKLELKDGEDGTSKWPLVGKEPFHEPHSSLSISVPDLVEDKHRAQNVLLNLQYIAAKDEANPIYAYDENALKDPSQLFQRQINQHIRVKGNPQMAIQPMRTTAAMTGSLANFLGLLKSEAAEAIGTVSTTPQTRPAKGGKKSATEASILQQIAELSGSLQSRVLAKSENEFWSHWYQRYIHNMTAADEKIISLVNVAGVSFEKVTLENIKTKYPPKIDITSSKQAEFKERMERDKFSSLLEVFQSTMDPIGFRNFMKHVFLPKFDLATSTIDMVMRKPIEEIKAEQENELIEQDEFVRINETDEDETHIYTHYEAKNSASKWSHIYMHEQQLAQKKADAAAAQEGTPPEGEQPPEGGQPQPGQGGPTPPGAPQPPKPSKKETTPVQATAPTAQQIAGGPYGSPTG